MDAHVYKYNFSYTSNIYESSYAPQVMIFYPISDPLTILKFHNIDIESFLSL